MTTDSAGPGPGAESAATAGPAAGNAAPDTGDVGSPAAPAEQAAYLAGRIERMLATDPRTNELGIRAAVRDQVVYLRGEVAGQERRERITEVVREAAPGMAIRNEVTVGSVPPAGNEEVLP